MKPRPTSPWRGRMSGSASSKGFQNLIHPSRQTQKRHDGCAQRLFALKPPVQLQTCHHTQTNGHSQLEPHACEPQDGVLRGLGFRRGRPALRRGLSHEEVQSLVWASGLATGFATCLGMSVTTSAPLRVFTAPGLPIMGAFASRGPMWNVPTG